MLVTRGDPWTCKVKRRSIRKRSTAVTEGDGGAAETEIDRSLGEGRQPNDAPNNAQDVEMSSR